MATPAKYVDETKGLSLVTQDGKNREQTCYLFTALDAVAPERKRQLPFLRNGGDEVDARCLRRTPNYIPRCFLTPLESWFEPIGIPELAGDSMKDLVSVGTGVAEIPPGMVHPGQFYRAHQPMMGMPHYPGVDLPLVIDLVGYRGAKEIQSLRGNEWEQGYVHEVQRAFFPDEWEKPIALRLIESRIKEVGVGSLKITGEELLEACEQARQYMSMRIGIENGLLQTRTKHNHTYSYSSLMAQYFAQMEMSPKDSASDVTNLVQELVKQLGVAQSPVQAPILGQSAVDIAAQIELAVKAALLAHGIGAPAATEYVCDGCEHEPFDTAQGLAMHKTRWCGKENEVTDEPTE